MYIFYDYKELRGGACYFLYTEQGLLQYRKILISIIFAPLDFLCYKMGNYLFINFVISHASRFYTLLW